MTTLKTIPGPGVLTGSLPLRRRAATALLLVALATPAYFGVGGLLAHRIDDNPDFAAAAPPPGGSRTVAVMAGLIEREVELDSWQANDPWFLPDGLLDDMPNFQTGIIQALARFSLELVDQLGRTRFSSEADPNLQRAAGFLQFPPDIWFLNFGNSVVPMPPSEDQFRAARQALLAYNERLARGEAVFDPRADSLAATVERVIADLGASSALIDAHLREESGYLINPAADDLFYTTKGRLYAYYLVLREFGRDLAGVIDERGARAVWDQALGSLREAATLRPPVVVDGHPESTLFANHLSTQGFHLKRALLQLKEVTLVLAV